ncbi:MAG: hypothetical protein ABW042_01580 [Phenylobacterium sp.]
MRARKAARLAVAVIALAACSRSGARQLFTIDLPPGCKIESRSLSSDFEVFDVLCNGRPAAGVYVGDHPHAGGVVMDTGLEHPSKLQAWPDPLDPDRERAMHIAASVKLAKS